MTRERRKVTFDARLDDLPDGVLVEVEPGLAALCMGSALRRWNFDGYLLEPLPAPHGTVTVLTPEPIVRVLEFGYRPRGWFPAAPNTYNQSS